jgi:hypothetical protein
VRHDSFDSDLDFGPTTRFSIDFGENLNLSTTYACISVSTSIIASHLFDHRSSYASASHNHLSSSVGRSMLSPAFPFPPPLQDVAAWSGSLGSHHHTLPISLSGG